MSRPHPTPQAVGNAVLLVALLAFFLTLAGLLIFTPAVTTLYIVGDSTASRHSRSTHPIAGWGEALPPFLPKELRVVNRAIPGRSSRSFYLNDWPRLVGRLRPGDWVLIQFGHNDHSTDPERHTDPEGSYVEFLKRFVAETRQAGARPILVTPIQRRIFAGGVLLPYFSDYAQAMRNLARREQLPLVDLSRLTAQLFQTLGEEGSRPLFTRETNGRMDNTHLSPQGAHQVAMQLAVPLVEILQGGTLPVTGEEAHHGR